MNTYRSVNRRNSSKTYEKEEKIAGGLPTAEHLSKKVVAVNDHGKYLVIESISEASRFANVSFQTIRTCRKLNRERKVLKKSWRQSKHRP